MRQPSSDMINKDRLDSSNIRMLELTSDTSVLDVVVALLCMDEGTFTVKTCKAA